MENKNEKLDSTMFSEVDGEIVPNAEGIESAMKENISAFVDNSQRAQDTNCTNAFCS